MDERRPRFLPCPAPSFPALRSPMSRPLPFPAPICSSHRPLPVVRSLSRRVLQRLPPPPSLLLFLFILSGPRAFAPRHAQRALYVTGLGEVLAPSVRGPAAHNVRRPLFCPRRDSLSPCLSLSVHWLARAHRSRRNEPPGAKAQRAHVGAAPGPIHHPHRERYAAKPTGWRRRGLGMRGGRGPWRSLAGDRLWEATVSRVIVDALLCADAAGTRRIDQLG